MDLSTLIGLLLGYGFVIFAIASKPGALFFFDVGSLLIVLGGTIGALFMNFPMGNMMSASKVFLKALMHKEPSMKDSITTLVEIAEKARREGILAIESMLPEIPDEFLKNGIRLAVDGTDPETIQAIMAIELRSQGARHSDGGYFFMQVATYGPAFGMIGTLVGLIQMLQALDDPSKIGVGMATALITTFYGAMMANLIGLPVSGKLALRAKEEKSRKAMIVEGILAIQSGDNPRIVADRLNTFLPPNQRQQEEKA
ncbi:MAG: motility protein A [Calditrichaeota bacterium]|nr:motility protein A [Candidatus Cloacimonadota bacterium]MCB1045907.1 motility protein A [Calditrichota bacterium]MCB9474723.1 motility protein A [Candidatus Delongbacteria bacterium]